MVVDASNLIYSKYNALSAIHGSVPFQIEKPKEENATDEEKVKLVNGEAKDETEV